MKESSSLIKDHPDFIDAFSSNMRIHGPSGAAVYTNNFNIDAFQYNRYWIVFFVTVSLVKGTGNHYDVVKQIAGCEYV